MVRVPANSEGLKTGLISKTELLPEVIIAETLTVVRDGGYLTRILNMNDEEVSLTVAELEECEGEFDQIQVDKFIAQRAVSREDRLRELRKRVRTDHLNNQEKEQL